MSGNHSITLIQSEISQQLMDELPLAYVQTFCGHQRMNHNDSGDPPTIPRVDVCVFFIHCLEKTIWQIAVQFSTVCTFEALLC